MDLRDLPGSRSMDQHPSAISSLFNLRWDQHLHRLPRAPGAHFLPRFVETIPPKKGWDEMRRVLCSECWGLKWEWKITIFNGKINDFDWPWLQ